MTDNPETVADVLARKYSDDDLHTVLQDWDHTDPDQAFAMTLAAEVLRLRRIERASAASAVPVAPSANHMRNLADMLEPEKQADVLRAVADALPAVPVESLGRDADEVLVAIKRGEGYEDVHPQLVADDAFGETPFAYRVVDSAPPPASVPDGWPIADQEERELGWNWNYKWIEELHDDAVKAGWYSSMEAIDHVLTKLATTPEESP